MSLTSQLANPNSPVNLYFKDNFKNISEFLSEDNKSLATCSSLVPRSTYNYPWSDVGHITEYLMCLELGVTAQELFPMRYMQRNSLYKNIVGSLEEKGFSNFPQKVHSLMLLAKIEANLRSSREGIVDRNFKVSDYVLEDVKNLYLNSLQDNPLLKGKYIYNPVFHLSAAVGGADADMIKVQSNGNMLLDVKTSKYAKISSEWIKQLLGYVFLDGGNEYSLKEIGVFMPRQNALLNWSVEEVVVKCSGFKSVQEAQVSFIQNILTKKYIPR